MIGGIDLRLLTDQELDDLIDSQLAALKAGRSSEEDMYTRAARLWLRGINVVDMEDNTQMRSLSEIRAANGEVPAGDGHPEIVTAFGGGSSIDRPAIDTNPSSSLIERLEGAKQEANDLCRSAFMLSGTVTSAEYRYALHALAKISDALTAAYQVQEEVLD
jgi:hypothetical protein